MRKLICVFSLTVLIAACGRGQAAQSPKQTDPAQNTQTQKEVAQAKQISPEEMMRAWEAVAKPGDNHKVLKPFVGAWSTTAKSWIGPSQPPQVSKGTAEVVWVLDGRFVQERYQGQMMGKPFKGQGITGYDNAQGKYVSTWIDTMNTGVFQQTGTIDPEQKAITFTGTYKCPATGEQRQARSVLTIAGNDRHVFEMYELDDSGREFKNLEIVYTRKK